MREVATAGFVMVILALVFGIFLAPTGDPFKDLARENKEWRRLWGKIAWGLLAFGAILVFVVMFVEMISG